MFSSAQDSTSHPMAPFVPSVTAIPWGLRSAAATAEPDSVSAPISQSGGAVATSVKTCSTDSTPAWAGEFCKVADTLVKAGQRTHMLSQQVQPLQRRCTDCLPYDVKELRVVLTFTARVRACRLHHSPTSTHTT